MLCAPIWYPLQRNWVSSSAQKGRKSYWCHWQNSYLSRVISHVKAHPLIQWILNIWKGQTLTFPSPLLLMQAWVLWLMKVSQAFQLILRIVLKLTILIEPATANQQLNPKIIAKLIEVCSFVTVLVVIVVFFVLILHVWVKCTSTSHLINIWGKSDIKIAKPTDVWWWKCLKTLQFLWDIYW